MADININHSFLYESNKQSHKRINHSRDKGNSLFFFLGDEEMEIRFKTLRDRIRGRGIK